MPLALSMIQFTRRGSRSARAAIDAGSTAYGAEQTGRVSRRAVRLDPLDRHDDGVARLRAFDVERSGLGIRTLPHLFAVPVNAGRINGLRHDPVAGPDPSAGGCANERCCKNAPA